MAATHSPAGSGPIEEALGQRRAMRVATDAAAVIEEWIPEGSGPPLHIHRGEVETFLLLEGRLRFRADEETFEAEPGAVVVIPPGTPHAFRGLGPGEARALIQLTPGRAAGFFSAVASERLSIPADMERIVEVARAHDMEIVGPPLD